MKNVYLLFLTTIIGLSSISAQINITEYGQKIDFSALPDSSEFEQYGAMIIYDEESIKYELNSAYDIEKEYSEHVVYYYHSQKAEDILSKIIYLDSRFELNEFKARIVKRDGSVIELTKNDLIPHRGRNEAYYQSNDKTVKFIFKGVEPGCILEYFYSKNQIGKSGIHSHNQWDIQEYYPKLYNKFKVDIPHYLLADEEIKWQYLPVNIKLPAHSEEENLISNYRDLRNSSIFTWELTDIPALVYEPLMPPDGFVAQYVLFEIIKKDWNAVSESYWESVEDKFNHYNQQVVALKDSICKDVSSEEKKVSAIFNYVQQNYRYSPHFIYDNGIVPKDYEWVTTNKMGDTKDLSVVLINLLQAADIEVYPALVKSHSQGKFFEKFFSFDFTYMISLVKLKNGKELWLNVGGVNCPAGEIFSGFEGRRALVIFKNGTSELKTIPESTFRDNQVKRNIALKIKKDGSVSGQLMMTLTGNNNVVFREGLRNASENDIDKFMKMYLNKIAPGIEISNLKYDDPDHVSDEMVISCDFSKEDYSVFTDSLIITNPFIVTEGGHINEFTEAERVHPIVFDFPTEKVDNVYLMWDKDLDINFSRYERVLKKFDFGYVYADLTKKGSNKIKFERRICIAKSVLLQDKYAEFMDYLSGIYKTHDQKVILGY